jgi:hypothetical protein
MQIVEHVAIDDEAHARQVVDRSQQLDLHASERRVCCGPSLVIE